MLVGYVLVSRGGTYVHIQFFVINASPALLPTIWRCPKMPPEADFVLVSASLLPHLLAPSAEVYCFVWFVSS